MGKEKETLTLFRKLDEEGLKYLVVGGMAVVLYGVERATFDIDIGISPSIDDIERLLKVLSGLGYKKVVDVVTDNHIANIDEISGEAVIEMESVKVRDGISVDILIVPHSTFDFMWEYRNEVKYKGVKIPIPCLIDLIRLKEKSGRPIDIEDAKKLRHILRTVRK